eukprot:gene5126-6235_t
MASRSTMDIQMQIRENSMEMSSYLSDLNDWSSEIKHKDDALKKGKLPASQVPAPASAPPPVRGRVAQKIPETSKPASKPVSERKQKKREEARKLQEARKDEANKAGHTYDYFKDKWDKFDIDKALEEVDEESSEDDEPTKPSGAAQKGAVAVPFLDRMAVGSELLGTPLRPGDIGRPAEQEAPKSNNDAAFAEKEKDKGNECYKKADYGGAMDCYSKSISLQPTCVAYANRAMAEIKLGKFQEAERDCSAALELDPVYIKALSRRGTARRHLGKYLESVTDFEAAILLEPGSKIHSQERVTSQALFEAAEKLHMTEPRSILTVRPIVRPVTAKAEVSTSDPDATAAATTTDKEARQQAGHSNKIKRRERTEAETEEQTSVPHEDESPPAEPSAGAGAVTRGKDLVASAESAAVSLEAKRATKAKQDGWPIPKSGLEFERTWKLLGQDEEARIAFIKKLTPTSLPKIFKDSLSASILCSLLRAILGFISTEGRSEPDDDDSLVALLEGLVTVPRFDMTVMFLTGKDKK